MDTGQVIRLRRRLHAHAEPGFMEYFTAFTIATHLERFGVRHYKGSASMNLSSVALMPPEGEQLQWAERAIAAGVPKQDVEFFRREGTALIAELDGTEPGPMWGLRVDMDALPIVEDASEKHLPQKEGFRSVTPYMHACGHDAHIAIGLGLISRLRDGNFAGTVRILFQPAEEGVRGASPMIAAGAVDGIDHMLALHVGGGLPVGTVVGGAEGMMATTKWQAEFTGIPAHAGDAPEQGRNALAAAAHATLGVLGMPRFSISDTRVNVGTFHADGSANIIPAGATITYETRADSNEVLEEMNRRTEATIAGAANMYGSEVRTQIYGHSASSLPDQEILKRLEQAADLLNSVQDFTPSGTVARGSDDAHLMIDRVQNNGGKGSYIWVGAQNESPHHNHRFDIDERSIGIAVDLLEVLFRESTAPGGAPLAKVVKT